MQDAETSSSDLHTEPVIRAQVGLAPRTDTAEGVDNLVSVIMAAYNKQQFIAESITSVIEQTHAEWELIIVDDASTDNTLSVIENFVCDDDRVRAIICERNGGAGIARNRGIAAAKGRYIAFLDADDLWRPNKLADQLAFMRKHKLALSYSRYDRFFKSGASVTVNPPEKIDYQTMLHKNHIGCLTAMYDTQMVGGKRYMPNVRKRQDYGLWLDIIEEFGGSICLNESLADYRAYDGMTAAKYRILASQWQFYREILGFSRQKSTKIFITWAVLHIRQQIQERTALLINSRETNTVK